MVDWTTIASLGTAAGTLVLATATFSSVRSANRAARVAERSLMAGLRPLLMPSHLQDPPQKISFVDRHWVHLEGGHGALEDSGDAIYLAMSLRNAGPGIAVLHSWDCDPQRPMQDPDHADPETFRRLQRDIYVPPGSLGFWQGALRDQDDPLFDATRKAAKETGPVIVDLLYGDHEGGQRTISRFSLTRVGDDSWLVTVARHWSLDQADPRH